MMKKYTEPELTIRSYRPCNQVFCDSDPESQNDNDLHKDDEYDYFGNN